MISLYIVFLFTKVGTQLALHITMQRLQSNPAWPE